MHILHDNVSGNWQKATTMVYEINQVISKREQEITSERSL